MSALKLDNNDLKHRADYLAKKVKEMEEEITELNSEKSALQKEVRNSSSVSR